MKAKILFPLLAATTPLFFTGCGTNAHYVQTGDKEQIISTGQINIQDYSTAASLAVQKLLGTSAIDKVANPPALIEISRIINNTSQQVDTDLLTKKISIALLQSGRAVTKTVDPLAAAYQQQTSPAGTRLPDFTLSGKIIETVDTAGDTKRTTYSFQLSLNDPRAGYPVWEDEEQIGKQGTRATVGF